MNERIVLPEEDFSTRKEMIEYLSDPNVRIAVYEFILNTLERCQKVEGCYAGMCSMVPFFIAADREDRLSTRLMVLPELWNKRPLRQKWFPQAYWFDPTNFNVRINLIKNIIKKMKAKHN